MVSSFPLEQLANENMEICSFEVGTKIKSIEQDVEPFEEAGRN